MVELIKDERTIKLEKGNAIITRVTIEKYDAGAYIRMVAQQEAARNQSNDMVKEFDGFLEELNKYKLEMEIEYEKQIKQSQKERTKAMNKK